MASGLLHHSVQMSRGEKVSAVVSSLFFGAIIGGVTRSVVIAIAAATCSAIGALIWSWASSALDARDVLVKPEDLRTTPPWLKSYGRVARILVLAFVLWGAGHSFGWWPIPSVSDWTYAGIGVFFLLSSFVESMVPAMFWFRALRRRRAGRCGRCGYDRTGLGFDAVCPECGTPARYPLSE